MNLIFLNQIYLPAHKCCNLRYDIEVLKLRCTVCIQFAVYYLYYFANLQREMRLSKKKKKLY